MFSSFDPQVSQPSLSCAPPPPLLELHSVFTHQQKKKNILNPLLKTYGLNGMLAGRSLPVTKISVPDPTPQYWPNISLSLLVIVR